MQAVFRKERYFAINDLLRPHFPVILLILSLLVAGCAPYRVNTLNFSYQESYEAYVIECPSTTIDENGFYENRYQALSHWLYQFIPRHRCQIQWFDIGHWITWTLFGNDDDGVFGPYNYRPHQRNNLAKALAWTARNPLHNFCFYVIGSAHRPNSEIDLLKVGNRRISMLHYKPQGNTVFASECSSLYLALHGGKPFISFRLMYLSTRRLDFYLGWRDRGNFGMKLLPAVKYKNVDKCINKPLR
jgi:hypothetical protein